MRRFVRDQALSLFFLTTFGLALAAQSIAGNADYNARQIADGGAPVSWPAYVTSSSFAVDVAENWQSEYLQFLLFILVTAWLVQRGSHESKPPGREGPESERDQRMGPYAGPDSPGAVRTGGLRPFLYSNSLGLVMGVIFVLSWLAQSVAGTADYNAGQLARLQDPVSWSDYVVSADFWNRTLQNWQSEFLAVLSMVVLSIYLRQRGSPESKAVGGPHDETET
ncbi:hypothetical protein JOL79_33015 [Microbispora sp. RL4-1S]|uniref:Uncharacterized protein n=1 Tax=Microbispora oryzae TaxID=2806554 RepID=A0A940WSI0_9ACTN|nr:DUF6766 family protein [Microbispora oryzae]MBP2708603.1 hypothetical protein [Microbispora oryzae]